MKRSNGLHDNVWIDRYGYVCPIEQGKIITIDDIGDQDYYNPSFFKSGETQLLAFRFEHRDSDIIKPSAYHPAIGFAAPKTTDRWRLLENPAPFEMLEDPTLINYTTDGEQRVLFGGVRVRLLPDSFVPRTEFYSGSSVQTLGREPLAIVPGMKDVRLLQLPDSRFLLCKRPSGGTYGNGRITLHVLDRLELLPHIGELDLPTLAVLDSNYENDWVGTNGAYILTDTAGTQWVGLLGHIALQESDKSKHYAVTTYKMTLENLLSDDVHKATPRVIATRACFEDGPEKTDGLGDVVFPGSLEALGNEAYRLWAGLSDTRIGYVIVDDPFGLRQIHEQP